MNRGGGRDESWWWGYMMNGVWRLVSEFIASGKNNACAYWAFEIALRSADVILRLLQELLILQKYLP